MSKQAVFTMKLEPELRAEFMAAAAAAHRPASQVLRELMREFVQRQRETRECRTHRSRLCITSRDTLILLWSGYIVRLAMNENCSKSCR